MRLDLKAYEASAGEFKREEEERFPEHRYMALSEGEINAHFKTRLDEIKKESGFIPDEVYISCEPDGRVTSVDMGATLLGMEVIFRVWADVRTQSKKPKFVGAFVKSKRNLEENWVAEFSFEREVSLEYNRCTRLFESLYRQLKSTWQARILPQKERDSALRFIEAARGRSLERMSAYRKTRAPNAAKKQVKAELNNLNFLEARIKMLDPRRA